MRYKFFNKTKVIIIFFLITSSSSMTLTQATQQSIPNGFEKGPSYTSVLPIKKTTLINFDKDSLVDDYAYLASIPTSVFYHNNKLFSHPLLFFEEEYKFTDDKERTLNARQGLDYFMQDWMEYCNGRLDQMTSINIPNDNINHWDASTHVSIQSEDPYKIASKIALQEWAYKNEAVVAVIDDHYQNPRIKTKGELTDQLPSCNIEKRNYKMQKPTIGTGATYNSFEITDETYKYIIAKMTWDEKFDYDLQLYDNNLGMVQASANSYKQEFPWYEIVGSYIHNHGTWETSVSALAKKSSTDNSGMYEKMCSFSTPKKTGLLDIFNRDKIDIDIALLPGKTIPFESTPYGCQDITFTLKWNAPNINLGFTILDPTKNEIYSTFSLEEVSMKHLSNTATSDPHNTKITLELDKLGECRQHENYSVCVFSLDDIHSTIDFSFTYEWTQNVSKMKGDCLESATNAAILASSLNAPLLYTNSKNLPKETKDALYKLGVKKIHYINIGNHASPKVLSDLREITNKINVFSESRELFDTIRKITGENDIIFSTIDPWTYWYVGDLTFAGEYDSAYHLGPAAYIAAHHGSPVLIVDNHPLLSQAITYPTTMWGKGGSTDRTTILPSSGAMKKTAERAYDFLEENGFGQIELGGSREQDKEIIITVAGQYDIGIPWDRAFTGAGLNGRFWGHPVDSAYAICRNVFYPAMIFVNPAMNKVTLTQGSESTNKLIGGRIQKPFGKTLVITKPMQEEEFEYPVLQSFITYAYRFNEENWKHFNCKYTRADNIIPWDTPSPDRIDDGAAHGKSGAYYPDISESEIIPFYCEKAGYDSVFSTSFDYIAQNLNDGVLLWCVQIHGHHTDGGNLEIWSIESPYVYEENPWRSYEPIPLKLGHFDEFIRWLGYYIGEHNDAPLAERIGDMPPRLLQIFPDYGSTDNPDVAMLNPQLTFLAKITRPIFDYQLFDIWGPWPFMIYRDRWIHPFETIKQDLPFINWAQGDGKSCHSPPSGGRLVGKQMTGVDFDNALENLHSCGINSISCFPANTYLHLTWMRHGTTYQIIDPWSTTDWAGVWNQMLIKYFAMGYTVGEAYERGLRATGPLYSVGQWWWDLWENICYYGDPNLRVFVPNDEYVDFQNGYEENYWTSKDTLPLGYSKESNFDGHNPFGATNHPNKINPDDITINLTYLSIFAITFILLILIILIIIRKNKQSGKNI